MLKSYGYLAFPIGTTLLNLLLASFLSNNKVHAQVPANAGIEAGASPQCIRTESGLCIEENVNEFLNELQNGEEEDPMLMQMPTMDFKAYRRADISSFYQEPEGSRVERTPKFNGQAGKFVNLSPDRLQLNWISDSGEERHICTAGPFESCGTATFPTHRFNMVKKNTNERVCAFYVKKGTSVYYCNPFEPNDLTDPSQAIHDLDEPLSLDTLNERQRELYDAAIFNREFGHLYKEFTGGSEWLTQYPSQPPKHHIWRADHFGQEHVIETDQTHFIEMPPYEEMHHLSTIEMSQYDNSAPLPFSEYREQGTTNITIKAVSCAPRIFQIDNFLSEVEVDHLLELALRKQLRRSTTGTSGEDAKESSVRTSRTTWLPRYSSPIMDAILRRAADVLKIDESLLRHRTGEEQERYPHLKSAIPINEDLQIVHYDEGQEYTAHHDFGFPDTRANAPTRSINLCMYLNEGMEGGETAFPRWRNAETNEAVKAVPKKGKAMIFYMRNPDGNLDDLSQHAALPVIEGEKWFANLWTWDPARD